MRCVNATRLEEVPGLLLILDLTDSPTVEYTNVYVVLCIEYHEYVYKPTMLTSTPRLPIGSLPSILKW